MLNSQHLEQLFNQTFLGPKNTRLEGGAIEPLYQPANSKGDHHRIIYREDFVSSALHEIAHWCIAGEERRQLVDFGYWYNPDGRSSQQQRSFEQVEIKPQALEWILSMACGQRFTLSADNLNGEGCETMGASQDFIDAVSVQAMAYCEQNLPADAALFIKVLATSFGVSEVLNPLMYKLGHSAIVKN